MLREVLRDGKLKGNMVLDAKFILKHWRAFRVKRDGKTQWRYSCDMFDTVTRKCTAHKDRPPICSNYPWYGKKPEGWMLSPTPDESAKHVSCSYWFDIPKKDRPDWATPVRLRRRR
jgi:Fe-S-cluster containining protein